MPWLSMKTTLWFVVGVFLLSGNIANSKEMPQTKPIAIDITTHLGNVQQFQEGDDLAFLVSLDTDAYLLVIYETVQGELIQLLPNKVLSNSFYKAGLFINLPEPGAGFVFKILPPFGKETLWVFAADVMLPELAGHYLEDGLKKLTVDITTVRERLARVTKSAYGESRMSILTSPKQ